LDMSTWKVVENHLHHGEFIKVCIEQ